jgi:tRNA-dihydrouridine synthase
MVIGVFCYTKEIKTFLKTGETIAPPSLEDRIQACVEHLEHSIVWKGEKLGVIEMRRHYTNYFRGLPNVKSYRSRLVTEDNWQNVMEVLNEMKIHYQNMPIEVMA